MLNCNEAGYDLYNKYKEQLNGNAIPVLSLKNERAPIHSFLIIKKMKRKSKTKKN
jgi:hypothetical protein